MPAQLGPVALGHPRPIAAAIHGHGLVRRPERVVRIDLQVPVDALGPVPLLVLALLVEGEEPFASVVVLPAEPGGAGGGHFPLRGVRAIGVQVEGRHTRQTLTRRRRKPPHCAGQSEPLGRTRRRRTELPHGSRTRGPPPADLRLRTAPHGVHGRRTSERRCRTRRPRPVPSAIGGCHDEPRRCDPGACQAGRGYKRCLVPGDVARMEGKRPRSRERRRNRRPATRAPRLGAAASVGKRNDCGVTRSKLGVLHAALVPRSGGAVGIPAVVPCVTPAPGSGAVKSRPEQIRNQCSGRGRDGGADAP